LERSRHAPGACPECGSRPGDIAFILAIAPREPDKPYRPAYREPSWATPWFCGTCGRQCPAPIINVQAGDEDSPLVWQLISKPPAAVEVEGQWHQEAGNAHP
jgi:hypothetical protein